MRPDAPPFLVIHGDQDLTLPVENARHFSYALHQVSRCPVVYAELPDAQHIFDMFRSVRGDAVANGVEAFTDWVQATAPDLEGVSEPRFTERIETPTN